MEHICLSDEVSRDEWIWHYRFGHLNFRDLYELKRQEMVTGLPQISIPTELCEDCVESKQHRNTFNQKVESKSTDKLEIIYTDVCGPMQCDSLGGSKYFVSFIDDYTRKTWIYLIKAKSKVLKVFKKFKAMVSRQTGKYIKVIRSDGEELKSIEKNNTWALISLPPNKKAINVKWAFKVKEGPNGEVLKHKARLVVRGFLQKAGNDYGEVFAPVARMETFRLVVLIASLTNWKIHQMDVKSAFLNSPLEEEVFVKQPQGFLWFKEATSIFVWFKAST